MNTFYVTYGGGPPTGDTLQKYNSAGTPVVVTGAPNPGVFDINQSKLSDNLVQNAEELIMKVNVFKLPE